MAAHDTHDKASTRRQVSTDALDEAEVLYALLEHARPDWSDSDRRAAILRAFGWADSGSMTAMLALYLEARRDSTAA